MGIPYSAHLKPIHIFMSAGVIIGLLSFAFATDAFASGGGGGEGIAVFRDPGAYTGVKSGRKKARRYRTKRRKKFKKVRRGRPTWIPPSPSLWQSPQQPQGGYQPDTFIGQGNWKGPLRPDPPKKTIPGGLYSPWDPPPGPVAPLPFPDISTVNDAVGNFLNALSGKKSQLAGAAHTLINVLWNGSGGDDFNDAIDKGAKTAVKSAGALLGAATAEAIAIALTPETGPLSIVTIPAAKFVGSMLGGATAGAAYEAVNSADVQVEDLAPMTEWADQAVP